MLNRSYRVVEGCAIQLGLCDNEARATSESGTRVCGIHAAGALSLRDADIPQALDLLDDLLNELDKQKIPVCIQGRIELRNMIGRRLT